ncbi:hypothetical protein H3C65_00030 [Patescibacteria group bacterium]|nr:hypothetical protein [Patescibacteria group bacterium]
MSYAESAVSLAQYAFNPDEKVLSRNSFENQLESYALHVVEDRPVSNKYSYYLKDGEIFIDNSYSNNLFLDPEERGGYSGYGTRKAIDLAMRNKGSVILHYSPPGPVAFEEGTKYDLVKPYGEGQLYLLVANSSNEVDSLAISVGKEYEERVLKAFFKRDYVEESPHHPVEKVKYYLSNPQDKNQDIDFLLTYLEGISYIDDFNIYKNIRGEEFRLSEVIRDMMLGWSGKIKPRIKINYEELYNLAVNKGVSYAYFQQLGAYHSLYQKGGKMALGGSCGGSEVNGFDLDLFDPKSIIEQVTNPLSSFFRLSTSLKDIIEQNENERYEDYSCPNCGKIHRGELKGSDRSTWRKECSCGYKFDEC